MQVAPCCVQQPWRKKSASLFDRAVPMEETKQLADPARHAEVIPVNCYIHKVSLRSNQGRLACHPNSVNAKTAMQFHSYKLRYSPLAKVYCPPYP